MKTEVEIREKITEIEKDPHLYCDPARLFELKWVLDENDK